MGLFDWLPFVRKVGDILKRALGIVEKVVPEAVLEAAETLAKEAITKFVDNDKRRDWVTDQLVSRFGISLSIARLAVELAVQMIKDGMAKV